MKKIISIALMIMFAWTVLLSGCGQQQQESSILDEYYYYTETPDIAEDYQETTGETNAYNRVIEYLESEEEVVGDRSVWSVLNNDGFTDDEIDYAIKKLNISWYDTCKDVAKSELKAFDFANWSKQELIDSLYIDHGFNKSLSEEVADEVY